MKRARDEDYDPFAAANTLPAKRRNSTGDDFVSEQSFISLSDDAAQDINPQKKFVLGEHQLPPWAPYGLQIPNTPQTLHDEILGFCKITAPTELEMKGRESAVDRLRELVHQR